MASRHRFRSLQDCTARVMSKIILSNGSVLACCLWTRCLPERKTAQSGYSLVRTLPTIWTRSLVLDNVAQINNALPMSITRRLASSSNVGVAFRRQRTATNVDTTRFESLRQHANDRRRSGKVMFFWPWRASNQGLTNQIVAPLSDTCRHSSGTITGVMSCISNSLL